jgi:hypothetical protein
MATLPSLEKLHQDNFLQRKTGIWTGKQIRQDGSRVCDMAKSPGASRQEKGGGQREPISLS